MHTVYIIIRQGHVDIYILIAYREVDLLGTKSASCELCAAHELYWCRWCNQIRNSLSADCSRLDCIMFCRLYRAVVWNWCRWIVTHQLPSFGLQALDCLHYGRTRTCDRLHTHRLQGRRSSGKQVWSYAVFGMGNMLYTHTCKNELPLEIYNCTISLNFERNNFQNGSRTWLN